MKLKYLLAAVSCYLGLTSLLWTDVVPPLINYQGRLANADGAPFPTADYELRISLFDAATNGNLVWGPQVFDGSLAPGHSGRVPIVQGHFNVMLGPSDTLGRSILVALGDSHRFVEVAVSNRPPISPRQRILTTPYAAQAGNGSPPGSIIAFGGSAIPDGWLLCDGAPVDRFQFGKLFAAIGTNWGHGDGQTTFNLPDLRGYFLRGVDSTPSAERDADYAARFAIKPGGATNRNVGSYQSDALKRHTHSIKRVGLNTQAANTQLAITADNNSLGFVDPFDGVVNQAGDSGESRPKNAYVNYVIKF